MTTDNKYLQAALEYLNDNFGRGDIINVSCDSITVKLQYGTKEYNYWFDGETVRCHGHQVKITSSKLSRRIMYLLSE